MKAISVFSLLWFFSISASLAKLGSSEQGKGPAQELKWLKWQPGLFDAHRKKGDIVWLSFTADWCLSCEAMNRKLFSSQDLRKALAAQRVVLIKADLSDHSPALIAEMKKLGFNQLPVNLVGLADLKKEVIFIPSTATPAEVIRILKN